MPGSKVYIPDPTWANHFNIWRDAGVEWAKYRYYKPDTRGLDFEGLMEDIHVRSMGRGGEGPGRRGLTCEALRDACRAVGDDVQVGRVGRRGGGERRLHG